MGETYSQVAETQLQLYQKATQEEVNTFESAVFLISKCFSAWHCSDYLLNSVCIVTVMTEKMCYKNLRMKPKLFIVTLSIESVTRSHSKNHEVTALMCDALLQAYEYWEIIGLVRSYQFLCDTVAKKGTRRPEDGTVSDLIWRPVTLKFYYYRVLCWEVRSRALQVIYISCVALA